MGRPMTEEKGKRGAPPKIKTRKLKKTADQI